jgi:endo-alpha-1,4-polygalactosaminidase (GH114 family)
VSLQGGFAGQTPAAKLDRFNYLNVYENVGWGGGTINWMNPQGDAWPAAWGWVTRENIKKVSNNPWGIKILAYVISYTQQVSGERFSVREPKRLLFNGSGAPHCISGFDMGGDAVRHRVPREKKQIPASGYTTMPDWSQDRNVYYWADEILKSAKEFGWKGVRFDGDPSFIAADSYEYYNAKGRRFTLEEKNRLSNEANDKFKKYIKSKAPDFLLYYNGEPSLDKVTLDPTMGIHCAGGSVRGSEVTRHMTDSSNPYNRWDELYERFALNVELCRQNGGFYSAIIAHPWMHMGMESTQLAFATLFATGTQPWLGNRNNEKYDQLVVPYFKTMTRYSSLFWGHGLSRVAEPEKSISVTAPKSREIWWKRTPSMRTTLGGKKMLIMTFINKPPTERNLGTKQTLPEPIEEFTVSFKPLEGKLPAKVWNIQPWPDTVTTELPIRKEGDHFMVTVPRLDYASVLVAELQ